MAQKFTKCAALFWVNLITITLVSSGILAGLAVFSNNYKFSVWYTIIPICLALIVSLFYYVCTKMKENYNPSEISPPQFESWGPVIVQKLGEIGGFEIVGNNEDWTHNSLKPNLKFLRSVKFSGIPPFHKFIHLSVLSHTAETIDQPKFDPSTLEKNNQRRTEVYVIQQSANVLQTHKQLQAKINYLQK